MPYLLFAFIKQLGRHENENNSIIVCPLSPWCLCIQRIEASWFVAFQYTLEESTTAGQKEVNKSVATVAKAFKVLMMGVNENIFGGEFDETSYSCCSKNGEKCQHDKQCESGWCDWHGFGHGTCETCPPKEEQSWADSCDPK